MTLDELLNEKQTPCPCCGHLQAVVEGVIAGHTFAVDGLWERANRGKAPPICFGSHFPVQKGMVVKKREAWKEKPEGLRMSTIGNSNVFLGSHPGPSQFDELLVLCPGCGSLMPIIEGQIALHSPRLDASRDIGDAVPTCPNSRDVVIPSFHDVRPYRLWALRGEVPKSPLFVRSGSGPVCECQACAALRLMAEMQIADLSYYEVSPDGVEVQEMRFNPTGEKWNESHFWIAVKLEGWADRLGFCVTLEVDERHTDDGV